MYNPHTVTKEFEAALCEYTGARFAVTTTSCTMALLLAMAWYRHRYGPRRVLMPHHSYVGVPAAVLNAGHTLGFAYDKWTRDYTLTTEHDGKINWWVNDCAWRLEPGMCIPRQMHCVSFHWTKPLGIGQGGAILHDCPEADKWLRRARFDGRTEGADAKRDQVTYPSWHAYMSPETAATGLMRLNARAFRTDHMARWSDYPDLSKMDAFK